MSKIYEEYLKGCENKHKLEEVFLLQLLPENLRNDPDIIAASIGADKEFRPLAGAINHCLTFGADIDNLSSEVVDNLAGEMNVDFYDQKNLTLDKRRELVKNGYTYKFTKGTADAVKKIVSAAFDNTTVQEWFEYGGKTYHFKISTETALPNESKINDVVRAVNSVKNARSTLECVEALKSSSLNTYYGFGVKQTCYHSIAEKG
jgi:Bacteriophage P2-related tail formation protein